MKRVGIAGLLVTAVLVSGCSDIVNRGGDTTCKEFRGQDEPKQRSTVAKMLKDEHGREPVNIEISGARMAVDIFCKTLGTESSKIRDTTAWREELS